MASIWLSRAGSVYVVWYGFSIGLMGESGLGEWVAERDLAGVGVRLFCLPHAGAGVAGYYRWKRLLAGVAVCPVMLPGREARLSEAPLRRVDAIVDGVHGAVRARLGERPYAIFGHSMGALLAYAWAKRIAEEGLPGPERLIVSGRNAPGAGGAGELHRLGDEAFLEGLGRRYGGMEVMKDRELRAVFLPILRADLEAVETFVDLPGKLGCPVSVFAGEADAMVSDRGLAGWQGVTSGEVRVESMPGGHFYHLGGAQGELLGRIRNVVGGSDANADSYRG